MGRNEKIQPEDYPVWKKLINNNPQLEKESNKAYAKRLSNYAIPFGLPSISDKISKPLIDSTDYDNFLFLKNEQHNFDNNDADNPSEESQLVLMDIVQYQSIIDAIDSVASSCDKEEYTFECYQRLDAMLPLLQRIAVALEKMSGGGS